MAETNLLDTLRDYLSEIDGEKKASAKTPAVKKADATDSSHPTNSAPDGLTTVSEGEAGKAMSATVKEQGGANSVEAQSTEKPTQTELTNSTQEPDFPSESGPGDLATKMPDPNDTSSPATSDDARKYGSYTGKPFAELYKAAGELGNEILAAISAQGTQLNQKPAAPTKAAAQAPVQTPAAPAQQPTPAKAAAQTPAPAPVQKQPELTPEQVRFANASAAIEGTYKEAMLAADLVGQSLRARRQAVADQQAKAAAAKKAEEDAEAPREESDSGDDAPAPKKEEAPAAPSGEAPPPPTGGAGGDPMAGGGGAQDAAGAIQELLNALMEHGVTPDDILQALTPLLQGGGAGGGGGMGGAMPPPGGDPMGGGVMPPDAGMGGAMPPPGAGAGMPPGLPPGLTASAAVKKQELRKELHKLASDAKTYLTKAKKAGTFKLKRATTEDAQKQRDEIYQSVMDILR